MGLSIDTIFAIIFRLGMTIVYGLLARYFYKGYKKSRTAEFRNNYFLGFTLMFISLTLFSLLYGSYELYSLTIANPIRLDSNFSWFNAGSDPIMQLYSNQMRPLYLIFYILLNLMMAFLIYPLEQAMNWKKSIFTKFLIVCGCLLWLLYIPVIGNTYIIIILITLGFTGIGIGLILNIGVNLKIFKDSTGVIRKRSLLAIFAFILMAAGILWSLKVSYGAAIYSGITNEWDVVIGSIIQIIAVIFYFKGFSQDQLST